MADATVVIGVDNKGALAGIKQVGTSVEDVGKKADKAGSSLGTVAKIAGGFVVAQGLLKLPGLLGGVIGGASDMNESLSKVRTVFGDSAKDIESWASTAAKSMGMTKSAALEASGTFGNFLQAMGATTPQATAMSKTMVQLAADLGSFNNADPTEVLLALRSGLSGEAEPLRKFGVALSEAAVSAKAVQLGLSATGKELTEQQKIQARYAIIMEQTKTAQGDFARTSDGLANQTKILKSMFADAANELGMAFLPAITSLMGALIQVLPFVVSLGTELGGKVKEGILAIVGPFADFVRYIQAVNEDGDTMNDWLSHLPGWLQPAAQFAGEMVEPLKTLAGLTWGALTTLLGLAWDAVKDGAGALGKLAGLAWEKLEGPAKALASIAWGALKDGADALAKLPGLAWDKMEGPLRALADIGWDALKDAAEAAENLTRKVQELAPQVKELSDRTKDGSTNTDDLAKAWKDLNDKLEPAKRILEPLVKDIMKQLDGLLPTLRDGFKDLSDAVVNFGRALEPLKPLLEPIGYVIGIVITGAIAAVLVQFDLFIRMLKFQFESAITLATQLINDMAAAISGVISVAQTIAGAVGGAFEAAKNALSGPITTMIGWVDSLIEKLRTLASLNPLGGSGSFNTSVADANFGRDSSNQMMAGEGWAPLDDGSDFISRAYSTPGGMGNPSVGFVDPRGSGLTADDIYAMKQDPNFGFVGLTVNIGTVNARDAAEARSVTGDIAYQLATAGMVSP